MAEHKRGLGRGLQALLGEGRGVTNPLDGPSESNVKPDTGAPYLAPIEQLSRNPDQPRKLFSEAEIDDLAASIREKGILQPILVRPLVSRGAEGVAYQIIAGERRWRAAQKAGLHSVPVIIREFDDLEALEIGIVENVQREDLNPIEEAQAYKTLMERFGRTQDAVAQIVGKSRPYIANAMRLLGLPESVQALVLSGKITAGHARALIGHPQAERLAEMIFEKGLSVRQVEQMIRDMAKAPSKPVSKSAPNRQDADTVSMQQDLETALGLKVALTHKNGKGELRLAYETLEQLDEVCKRLMGSI